MFCSRCGNEIKGDGKFCPNAGLRSSLFRARKRRLPAETARIIVIIRGTTAREVMPGWVRPGRNCGAEASALRSHRRYRAGGDPGDRGSEADLLPGQL